jgi:hypothetical protein
MATLTLDALETINAPVATEKVHVEYTQGRIVRATVRDLFAAGVLNKIAYVALNLRLDQPTTGELQEIDPVQYAEEITFEAAGAKGKDKTYAVSPGDVESAIASLQKKGALKCEKPPVQLTIGLMY